MSSVSIPALQALLCVLLASLSQVAQAHSFSLKVSNDKRRVMDLGVFGFEKGGIAKLHVRSISLASADGAEKSQRPIGFTLDKVETALLARREKNHGKGAAAKVGRCFIQDEAVASDVRHLFELQDFMARAAPAPASFDFPSFEITTPGLYALFFYNCKKFNNESEGEAAVEKAVVPVTFDVSVSFFNVDRDTNTRNYLSYGKRFLPEMYSCFTFLFVGALGAWAYILVTNKQRVMRIHHLMTILLVFKILSLFCETMREIMIRRTGESSAWSYFYYTFLTFKGMMLFLVILLIGAGWSLLKPFLSQKEHRIIYAILPLQILIHVALSVIETTSEGDPAWSFWRDVLLILDVACCFFVLLPMLWSIKRLKESANVDGKEQQTINRLKQFNHFYGLALGFIYFTRLVVPLAETAFPFRRTWMGPFLSEVAAFLFYCTTGWRFRPAPEEPEEGTEEMLPTKEAK